MSLTEHKKNWEELAKMDPMWAVLTNPSRQFGAWTHEEFFSVGQEEIDGLMESARALGYPARYGAALDFGCGVGRLTRPLAGFFERCVGVDISEGMVEQARALNTAVPNCEFVVNTEEDLRIFPDASFDLVYTNNVLQHIPSRPAIRSYVAEFVRTLKPGGLLVFQLPSHIPLKNRIQPRRRLYALLRALGVRSEFLYEKLRLHPIQMNFLPEVEVVQIVQRQGGRELEVRSETVRAHSNIGPHEPTSSAHYDSRVYYVTR